MKKEISRPECRVGDGAAAPATPNTGDVIVFAARGRRAIVGNAFARLPGGAQARFAVRTEGGEHLVVELEAAVMPARRYRWRAV
ncbi:MAG: hypothetical protein KGJ70_09910, partial [Gemmatimonadota bacterium]|nr:hypothetical protein [Gemmatimonadota bacterium]